jgi:phosphomannomutase
MALVLHLLAATGRTVSELVNELPRTFMLKEKFACRSDRIGKALKKVRDEYARYPQDLRDGVKVTLPDGWLLVRGSNTEPIIRLVAEAESGERAREMIEDLRRCVAECLGE